MKKKNILLKSSLVLALGLGSIFGANKMEAPLLTRAQAVSQSEASEELRQVKISLEAKKSIFQDKLEFINEFKQTNAYKNASSENKAQFDEEAAIINDAYFKVTDALLNEKDLGELKKVEKDTDDAMLTMADVLNKIYMEDEFLSQIVKANLAIDRNDEKYIPQKYKKDYQKAAKALKNEYQEIWLENKVYNEKELKKILDDYQAVVADINQVNRNGEKISKLKKAIKSNEEKIRSIESMKELMPETVKRHQETVDNALAKARKAVEDAKAWLAENDK